MRYVVATDVGGTCTDTVIIAKNKDVIVGKVLSTPPDFERGVIDSVSSAAEAMDMSLEQLLAETFMFIHGSTIVDNTLVERTGSNTGLLTTEGFEDTLIVTRGAYGRWAGLTDDGIKHLVATDRPPPLVPPENTRGVPERIDYKGSVIRELDEEATANAIRFLIENKNVSAIAVCLLWSFNEPKHERRIREIISDISPETYVSISSEIAPIPGEYERTSTTVINAYAGRIVRDYVNNLETLLADEGYLGPLLVMQGYGGLLPASKASERSVGMLECGPVAGVIGSQYLGQVMQDANIIAADMGGTTFKVGIIENGELRYAREPVIERFHYEIPKIDVISIGVAGGSVITLDPDTGVPRVGPRSAGARPGPVCYGLGGTEPTLTDVLLLIGYMDPERFLRGTMRLDPEQAHNVFKTRIADPLGLSVTEAGFGIFRIAAAKITDLIRQITVEQGLDPRDFVLHAFGGSCGMIAGSFGKELSVQRIVVPNTASVNCAFGLVSADIVHEYVATQTHVLPVDVSDINAIFAPMMNTARNALKSEGFEEQQTEYNWSVAFRYSRQVHEIITPVRSDIPLTEQSLTVLVDDFEKLYESRYGKGSAFREAGIEMTQFRVTARGLMDKPQLKELPWNGSDPSAAWLGTRNIFAENRNALVPAEIYDFERLQPGNTINGPAVIHTPITTIVIEDGQSGLMDGLRNIVIH